MGIYLNNAATTYPKPASVLEAVSNCLAQPPVEPGRTGGGDDPTMDCRRELAELFAVGDPRQVILTPSATYALNLVIHGLLKGCDGAHAITTALEHNSVLRPLEHCRQDGQIDVTVLDPDSDGVVDLCDLFSALRDETRLIALTHASNVTGCIQPVEAVAEIAAEAGVPLLVDASQSAGAVPLDYGRLPGRVFVAFAGHKGLFGPPGTGGLIVPDDRLPVTIVGGTGVQSENRLQPDGLPLRYEAGTMNLPGIAGLTEGVRFVTSQGVRQLGQHRHELIHRLRDALGDLPGMRLSPLARDDGRAGIVAFTLEGFTPEDLGFVLRESFDIETRSGLHCAPRAHQSLGTSAGGSVRASVAALNTAEDIDRLIEALASVETPCAR